MNPEKTYQTAVVLIPPETVWEPIQEIRRRHDKQIERWMPHITLLYPFRPQEEFDRLAGEFREVCRKLHPFEMSLSGYDHFKHKGTNYTYWLRPEPKEALVELQNNLLAITPNCREVLNFGQGFIPHLSVGQAHSKRVCSVLEDKLSALEPVNFTVKSVSMIWRNEAPDDVFRVGKTIMLGR